MKILLADLVLAGEKLSPVDHGAVVVEDGLVTWVGREADLASEFVETAPEVERLGDVTVLPGLIDAHVHLGFDGGPEPVARMMAESDPQQTALMLRSARELLSVGVTTARDLGARGYLDVVVRDAIADGTALGPRLVTAGAPLTTTGGHCWFMGAECDSEDEVRRMVRQHHKRGVDAIKVMATGGNMTAGSAPWHAQFTLAQLCAIVDEAHRLGKRVAAHCHGIEGIERALDAGVDTLEHCSFQRADGAPRVDPELADRVAASQAWVSPTCNLRLPEIRASMPDHDFAVGELYRRGARMIASTDAGINHTPHHGYVGGLEAMAGFEIPTFEVLLAATSQAAEALDLGDVTGRLAPGYTADLVAVGGDPRADLAVLHDLRLVMARGVRFTPDPLPAIEPFPLDELPAFLKAAPGTPEADVPEGPIEVEAAVARPEEHPHDQHRR